MTDPCCKDNSCKKMLATAIEAYNEIITGNSVAEVTIDGETTEFQRASSDKLLAHIQRLHAVCGDELSGAIIGQTGRRSAIQLQYADSHIRRPRRC